ncbi:MAG: acyl-CoA dehydrogenase N-terminal domain-containing protein, partial [Gammaproteobacteria bacterium]|nr:acyl-CoA dehydrogenase N-terminal domain-containing protein [Gammaproteobacteria bacterium]
MTIYKAPVEDIKFLFDHVLNFQEISKLSGYEDASPDIVEAILEQAAKFYEQVLSPTNKIADYQSSRLEGNKVITAPILD